MLQRAKKSRSCIRCNSSGEAIEINWNVEQDELGFQVQLPKNSLTRHGLLLMLSSVYGAFRLAGSFILEGRSII